MQGIQVCKACIGWTRHAVLHGMHLYVWPGMCDVEPTISMQQDVQIDIQSGNDTHTIRAGCLTCIRLSGTIWSTPSSCQWLRRMVPSSAGLRMLTSREPFLPYPTPWPPTGVLLHAGVVARRATVGLTAKTSLRPRRSLATHARLGRGLEVVAADLRRCHRFHRHPCSRWP